MDQLARELFAYDRVASAVVTGVSVHVGDRWVTDVGAAGRLARGTNEPSVSTETWFDLASLTKPVTALAAARLVRAGKLDLRTSLESLVQEVVGTASEGVPLELLLAHRAGLEGFGPSSRPNAGRPLRGSVALRPRTSGVTVDIQRRSATGHACTPPGAALNPCVLVRALSSAGERSLHTGEVAGSIPAAPTIFLRFSRLR